MPSDPPLSARLLVESGANGPPRLDVALEIARGITAVMGPSGAGKSTLLLALAGLVRPRAGRIVLGGATLFDADARVFVPPHLRRISLVFQSLALFPHLTAWENVAYGLSKGGPVPRRERAVGWLERARVAHVADRYPATLSGGEAQRVALARAFAPEPRLLLLDEPFSALDAALRCDLEAALVELVAAADLAALLVTHDARGAEQVASRVLRLEAGRMVESRAASTTNAAVGA